MRAVPEKTLLAVAFLFMAGCSPSSPTASIVLKCTDWGDASESKILNQSTREFEQAHPGVQVEMDHIPYAEYITKLLTEFSGGSAPDVMGINAEQLPSFASKGILLDLNPYIAKDPEIHLADFYPEVVAHYTVDGTLTALPKDIAPVAVIYYNKKMFDEAGLPYPKSDWDYRQFLFDAQQLTRKDAAGRILRYGFADEWGAAWDDWVYDFGGTLVDDQAHPTRCTLDSPQAIAGVGFRRDLIWQYHVAPEPSSLTAMGGAGNSELFINGKAAMLYSGIWKTPLFRQIKGFDWDVVEFPKGPGGKRGFPMSASGYGVVKSCKHPDLAYDLIKSLAGPEGDRYLAQTGLAQPALKAVANSTAFLDGQAPQSKGFLLGAVQYGHFQPMDPHENEWLALVNSALDRVWNGEAEVAPTLRKITAEINEKFYHGH